MLDMGWTEILIIGVVSLIVVGPKDLPRMLRTLGQYVGKVRGMAREFQRSMDDAAREADLEEFNDIRKSIKDVRAVGSDAAKAVQEGIGRIDKELDSAADTKGVQDALDSVKETPINAPADPIPAKAPATPPAGVESTAAESTAAAGTATETPPIDAPVAEAPAIPAPTLTDPAPQKETSAGSA